MILKLVDKVLRFVDKVRGPPPIDIDALVAEGENLRGAYGPVIKNENLERARTYASYAGYNTQVLISDEEFVLANRHQYERWGTVQAVNWITDGGFGHGTLKYLILDDPRPPALEGRYVTLLASNEYGNTAVLASFLIKDVAWIKGSLSVDDIALEQEIKWAGQSIDSVVGPVENLNDT